MTSFDHAKLRADIETMKAAGRQHVPVLIGTLEKLLDENEGADAKPALKKWDASRKARAA